ncbi:MAG: hypothetical protein IJA94_02395 [Bacilli bacterium]|nr:hypothetical protein [Bacilli bacterium]
MNFLNENSEKDLHLVCSADIGLISQLIDEAISNNVKSFYIKVLCEENIFLVGYKMLEDRIDYSIRWDDLASLGFAAAEHIRRNSKNEILSCLNLYAQSNKFILLSFMTGERSVEYSLKNSNLLVNRLCMRTFTEYEKHSIKKCVIQQNITSISLTMVFSVIFLGLAIFIEVCAFIHDKIMWDYILGGIIFLALGIILLIMYFNFKNTTVEFCDKKIVKNTFSKKRIIYNITDIAKIVNYYVDGRLIKCYIHLKNNKVIKCYITISRGSVYKPHLDVLRNILETVRFIECLVRINNGIVENLNTVSLVNYR